MSGFGFSDEQEVIRVNPKVHAFYYAWYGNPEFDGAFSHWNHPILPHGSDPRWLHAGSYSGTDDIGANFYPALGSYSSNDSLLIRKHMEWTQQAGIGVLAISWWGKNDFAEKSLALYFDLAEEFGLKITFHIEPVYQTIGKFNDLISYLADRYGEHPALFRYQGKALYYIYDSYKVPAEEWAKILSPEGEQSIRHTRLDASFIGIWVLRTTRDFFLKSGFDGFYTYYASDQYVWGSNPENWPEMAQFANDHDLIFIPSVGPGYLDTRIRPWNSNTTVDRMQGQYYEQMFRRAIQLSPDFISITSFNEWHEGTQIEPAIPKAVGTYRYEDYGTNTDPMFYIMKTRELVDQF